MSETNSIKDLIVEEDVNVNVGDSLLVGPDGPQGPEGESAYEVAVRNGYEGTEEEWLNSISIPAKNTVGTEQIKDGAVTPEKTSFADTLEIKNNFKNNKIKMVIGRFSDGYWVTSEGNVFSTYYIYLYKNDLIICNFKKRYLYFNLIKLEEKIPGTNQITIANTFDSYTVEEEGIYCLQGVFTDQRQLTEQDLSIASNDFYFYSLYSKMRVNINELFNKALYFSHEKMDTESNSECINRLLQISSQNNIPVIIDKSIEINSPIYMKENSTLKGINSTKIKIIATEDFIGDSIIIINDINNSEISQIQIDGGCVYDWNTGYGFIKLGAETKGISIITSEINKNITLTRIKDISINNVNGIGFYIGDTVYEGIYSNIEIKCCNDRGIYSRGTDSQFSNFIIGNCNYKTEGGEKFGCSLEGGNNNYSNFKIYLSGSNGGLHLYTSGNNNYSNFNIQDCPYVGLFISDCENSNFTNFTIHRCNIGIITNNSKEIYILSQLIWDNEDTELFDVYRSLNNSGTIYADLICSVDSAYVKNEDNKTKFGKSYTSLNI